MIISLAETYPSLRTSATPVRAGSQPSIRPERATFASVMKNVGPEELSEAAVNRSLYDFLELYKETLLLVVRLREGDKELAAGLRVTALREEASVPVEPVAGATASRTQHCTEEDIKKALAKSLRPPGDRGLVARLAQDRHYGVALRKRITAEDLHPHRISVGREPNKDIVLRHASVSKLHCWFEMDEDGAFYVADAGSTNSTLVNERTVRDEPTRIEPGDLVRFGLVDAMVCSPRELWTVLSRGARLTV